ncbi:MAG: nucleoside deaminase [Rhodospirillales bacterium]|nr:nucleoside deaminase [Rhodospirillales bacterium]
MSKEPEDYMREAIALSRQSICDHHGGPFGAVIVDETGTIIGRGANSVTVNNDPTAHAEVMAIRDACAHLNDFNLSGCTIYSSCEPCPMCLSAIYWARIDKIYYANTQQDAADIAFDDAFLYEQVALPAEERTIPCLNLLRDEALSVFRDWAAMDDKTTY